MDKLRADIDTLLAVPSEHFMYLVELILLKNDLMMYMNTVSRHKLGLGVFLSISNQHRALFTKVLS